MPRSGRSYPRPTRQDTKTGILHGFAIFALAGAAASFCFYTDRRTVYRAAVPLGRGARVARGRNRFSPRKSTMGVTMKIDEEVPTMMPNRIARAKPRITSPNCHSKRNQMWRDTATRASAVAKQPSRNSLQSRESAPRKRVDSGMGSWCWAARVGVLLYLAACSGPPWTLSQSPSEINLRWYPDDTPSAAADAVAQLHCQSWGKSAELVSYDQDGSAQIGRYRCR
jgi:hypothetical protein